MQKWKSHKVVEAAKIDRIQDHGEGTFSLWTGGPAFPGKAPETDHCVVIRVSTAYMNKHQPKAGGYYVRYPDGYESFSPAEAFEGGYTKE